jgi:hypothetical protein
MVGLFDKFPSDLAQAVDGHIRLRAKAKAGT